jgi:hypothetical protein
MKMNQKQKTKKKKEEGKEKEKNKTMKYQFTIYIKHMILAIARFISQTFSRTNDAPRNAALAYGAN